MLATITVGPGATDRDSFASAPGTVIAKGNPANASGALTKIELWAYSNITNLKAGTFSDDGSDKYTPRDYETIGTVTSGSKQTFTGLDCDVATGDVIGAYWPANALERCTSGGAGSMYKVGDQFGAGQQTYSAYGAGVDISIYGEGSTPAARTPRHGFSIFQTPAVV